MSGEITEAEILENIEENVSVTSEQTIELNDWADEMTENDIKNDWGDHKSEKINMIDNMSRLKRPKYDPRTDGPIGQWVENEIMFLDYQSQNERTIVSSILNSLPTMICNNLMTYLKSNNIQRDGLNTQVLVKAITASNIDNSSEYANSYKTLRFSPSRHFDLQNYFTELKKFFRLSIKEKLSEESVSSFIVPFFRLGVPSLVKKNVLFKFFPDDDPQKLVNLAQKILNKAKDDEIDEALNQMSIKKEKKTEVNYQMSKNIQSKNDDWKKKKFGKNYDPNFKRGLEKPTQQKDYKSKAYCRYCKRTGHEIEKCYKKQNDDRRRTVKKPTVEGKFKPYDNE